MNWLNHILQKEARGRKFRPGDKVRFLTNPRKGKGRGIVLMPDFGRGEVVDYDSDQKSYRVRSDNDELTIHPRNIVPDSFTPRAAPTVVESPIPAPMVTPFPR